MNKCTSWFGHKFQPRYDTKTEIVPYIEFVGDSQIWGFPIDLQEMAEKLKNTTRTYVYDICVKCGEKVERNKA